MPRKAEVNLHESLENLVDQLGFTEVVRRLSELARRRSAPVLKELLDYVVKTWTLNGGQ